MKAGFIGLGRMGSLMVERLLDEGVEVVVTNRTKEKIKPLEEKGAIPAYSFEELADKVPAPRIIFLMVSAGDAVDETISHLKGLLSAGDIIIDGGNSNYKDSVRRHDELKERNIYFLDAGTSGGLEGARHGSCIMVGGEREAFEKAEELFRSLAVKDGYLYVGKSGAGHYIKTVHNAIEYSILQSLGEGFELMKNSGYGLKLDEIARLWNNGSVIRSWLLELLADALEKDGSLKDISPKVFGGTTGKWAVEEALEKEVPMLTTAIALFMRFRSRKDDFSSRVIAALRNEFGGHKFERMGQ